MGGLYVLSRAFPPYLRCMALSPGLHRIPVDGGSLAVEVLAGTTEPVLAIHGISSHRKLWNWLKAEAPDLTLVAPDLRGRADSFEVTGASSVPQHAQDVIAVLDGLGLDQVHVIGMSMGGFIAVELATRVPERIKSLVLVDGGFPMVKPAGLTEDGVEAVFADRLARLGRSWEPEEFAELFTASTAPMLDLSDPLLRDYLSLDLAPDGTVRLDGAALVSDFASVFFADSPWESLTVPVRFSHSEWASGEGTPPAYPVENVERYAAVCTDVRFVPGVDHAGSIMTKAGAVVAADLLAEALR
ncbi:MAG: Beta-ketoadipate enol-lactone hydrolase [Frankiales bacterium]|nr:Beta-ketoadipate enol-lactone hydrolase [Frankiales bacterium]